MDMKFTYYCRFGNLKGAKRIYKNHKLNIHANDDRNFRYACQYGK